jgi:hypothetical protein
VDFSKNRFFLKLWGEVLFAGMSSLGDSYLASVFRRSEGAPYFWGRDFPREGVVSVPLE